MLVSNAEGALAAAVRARDQAKAVWEYAAHTDNSQTNSRPSCCVWPYSVACWTGRMRSGANTTHGLE